MEGQKADEPIQAEGPGDDSEAAPSRPLMLEGVLPVLPPPHTVWMRGAVLPLAAIGGPQKAQHSSATVAANRDERCHGGRIMARYRRPCIVASSSTASTDRGGGGLLMAAVKRCSPLERGLP